VKPVTMKLQSGRAKAFGTLREAIDWMHEQEAPRCDTVVSVSMPSDLKELLRDAGPMSTAIRGLICTSLGVKWAPESKRGRGAITKFEASPRTTKTKKVRTA